MKILKEISRLTFSFSNFLKITFDMRDCFVFGGIALIAIGLSLIYIPIALIISGVMVFWLGVRRIK